jgi:uncharacterized protein (TIGR00369 family)
MEEIPRYKGCFVCGDCNPHGLGARFYWDGRKACTDIVVMAEHEGYKGICHGGILASLLDEVMVKAILATHRFAVTAEINVRYVQPVRTGTHLHFVGQVVGTRGRLYRATSEATDSDGTVVARAEAKFLEGRSDLSIELKTSLE